MGSFALKFKKMSKQLNALISSVLFAFY